MYAILEVGGKQYKVAPKDVIEVNKLDVVAKSKITLDKILLVADDKKVEIGQPYIEGAKVEAEVIEQTKGKKLVVYKYLRRKNSHKKTGHRQKLTKLLIKNIN
ncbi:MAG: 50S ribosomal protein L21 [Candidatus Omnitrophica bacterium]|nr:50S ribosomal protein L21 [Candidatus Omnitrophota bacterium]